MKREFKEGDRVLVRNSDLQEWEVKEFKRIDDAYPLSPFVTADGSRHHVRSQCRHIDDFRTGDKVQVRSSMNEEWEDAVYGCYVPHDSFEHWVYSEDEDDLTCHKLCRWHPSMPWAKEESLTLEEKVDKMWEQFKTNKQ